MVRGQGEGHIAYDYEPSNDPWIKASVFPLNIVLCQNKHAISNIDYKQG